VCAASAASNTRRGSLLQQSGFGIVDDALGMVLGTPIVQGGDAAGTSHMVAVVVPQAFNVALGGLRDVHGGAALFVAGQEGKAGILASWALRRRKRVAVSV
jgi:hypothetical protein